MSMSFLTTSKEKKSTSFFDVLSTTTYKLALSGKAGEDAEMTVVPLKKFKLL